MATSKSLKKQIYDATMRVWKLDEAYKTQLYLETMPEYGPLYQYCFQTSNLTIPYADQSVDAWLRAVAKHMSARKPGHGGAYTKAVIVSVPPFNTQKGAEKWLDYVTKQLRSRVMPRQRKKQPI